jgi:protein-S-isoprenylcysteine O-methyltransferase Ste14
MKQLENRIPPPIVVLLIGVSMAAAARALTPPLLPLWLRASSSMVVIAVGFSFMARAFITFRDAATTIDPIRIERASSLVTSGVFSRSRNPMYVGMATMLVGWALLFGSPWLVLGPVSFVAFTTQFQILPEERVMRARFGEAYAA